MSAPPEQPRHRWNEAKTDLAQRPRQTWEYVVLVVNLGMLGWLAFLDYNAVLSMFLARSRRWDMSHRWIFPLVASIAIAVCVIPILAILFKASARWRTALMANAFLLLVPTVALAFDPTPFVLIAYFPAVLGALIALGVTSGNRPTHLRKMPPIARPVMHTDEE